MRAVLFVVFFAVCVLGAVAHKPKEQFPVEKLHQIVKPGEKTKLDTCSVCITFMDDNLDTLVTILGGGIEVGCPALCSKLGNNVEIAICTLLCEFVGINEFVNILNDDDPEPVWVCQEVTVCPVQDGVTATINTLTVQPLSGPAGTTFNIASAYTFATTSGSAIGLLEVDVVDYLDPNFYFQNLLISQPAGKYTQSASINSTPGPNGAFVPGIYNITLWLCESDCGASHAHTYLIAKQQISFQITSS